MPIIQNDKIPLHIEVEYIRQYIELQKYRIAENFDVQFFLCTR